MHHIRR